MTPPVPPYAVVHLIDPVTGHEHTVTQAFLDGRARTFVRAIQDHLREDQTPRVCIAGSMDYLFLHAYAVNYLNPAAAYMEVTPTLPEGFPGHFTYRGVLVIRGLDERGFTFA
jgi:hypothetical protein